MNASTRRLSSTVGVGFTLMLILIIATRAPGSIPPAFVAQQQDLAVRVYCAHWRRTNRKRALEGDEVERVISDLEMLYPTAFSACRSDGERPCLRWLDALVQGLRRYDHLGLPEVCANSGPEDVLPAPGFKFEAMPSHHSGPAPPTVMPGRF